MRPAALIYVSHQEVYTKLEEAFLARECKEEGKKKSDRKFDFQEPTVVCIVQ